LRLLFVNRILAVIIGAYCGIFLADLVSEAANTIASLSIKVPEFVIVGVISIYLFLWRQKNGRKT